jgi:hypothetical protein
MKKRAPKLTLHFESLRLLDGPTIAGGQTDVNTCPPSCAPTCGIVGIPAAAGVVVALSARNCCV